MNRPIPNPFRYPSECHVRKHGPTGYANYAQFRDWLRDEFRFRCVFCLTREQWTQGAASYEIDHFMPRALRPDLEKEYDNLVYACRRCNLGKSSKLIPSPSLHIYGKCLVVDSDGLIKGLNSEGKILVDELDLDADDLVQFRKLWLRIVCMASALGDEDLLIEVLGLPADLPILEKKRPPGNKRPEGLALTWAMKKQNGEVDSILE